MREGERKEGREGGKEGVSITVSSDSLNLPLPGWYEPNSETAFSNRSRNLFTLGNSCR